MLLQFFICFLSFFAIISSRNIGNESESIFKEAQVFITISPDAKVVNGTIEDRKIVLNWFNWNAWKLGDHVKLWNSKGNELARIEVKEANGHFVTDITWKRHFIDIHGPKCQEYYIGYFDKYDHLLRTNCLKINPKWMNELKHIIGNTPVHSLMIPGTHNAGSWKFYDGSEDIYDLLSVCQEETIYDQLIYGIRYLDIRVGYYPETKEIFWINHNYIKFYPLKSLFDDVKKFVENTNEIVIIDFHRFPSAEFDNASTHEELVKFVEENIGDFLFSKNITNEPSIQDLWNAHKNVILTYAHRRISIKYHFLWPYLTHAWGDKKNVEDLHNYLNSTIPGRSCRDKYFWSAMAHLSVSNIWEDRLRLFAKSLNFPLSIWFQRKHWYSNVNIVSTDFFMGNNLIEMSIEVNTKRGNCFYSPKLSD